MNGRAFVLSVGGVVLAHEAFLALASWWVG